MNFSNTESRESGGLFSIPPPPVSSSRARHELSQSQPDRSLLDFGDFESPRTTSIPKPTPLVDNKSRGGLSAQDLSFFEGF